MSRRPLSPLIVVIGFLLPLTCPAGAKEAPKPEAPAILSDIRSKELNSVERHNKFSAWASENHGESKNPYLSAIKALEEHLTVTELYWLATVSIKKSESMAEISGLIDKYIPVSQRGSRYAQLIYALPPERVVEVEPVFAKMGPGRQRNALVLPLVSKRLRRDSVLNTAKWISKLPYAEDRKRAWPSIQSRVKKGSVPKEDLAAILKLTDRDALRTTIEKLIK